MYIVGDSSGLMWIMWLPKILRHTGPVAAQRRSPKKIGNTSAAQSLRATVVRRRGRKRGRGTARPSAGMPAVKRPFF